MVAHLGCGTWAKSISFDGGNLVNSLDNIWKRCFVDSCSVLQKARFCIPESQTWDLIPLSNEFGYTTNNLDPTNDRKSILLLRACCGRCGIMLAFTINNKGLKYKDTVPVMTKIYLIFVFVPL